MGWVFHFYCWSCSNVSVEEIVKLKLDQSYLSVPAESWQAGKTGVCSSRSFKAKIEGILKGFFLSFRKKTDPTTYLHISEGPNSLIHHWRPSDIWLQHNFLNSTAALHLHFLNFAVCVLCISASTPLPKLCSGHLPPPALLCPLPFKISPQIAFSLMTLLNNHKLEDNQNSSWILRCRPVDGHISIPLPGVQ